MTRPLMVLATKHAEVHKFFEDCVRSYDEMRSLIDFVILGFETDTDENVLTMLTMMQYVEVDIGPPRRPTMYMLGTRDHVTSNGNDLFNSVPLRRFRPTDSLDLIKEIQSLSEWAYKNGKT